MKTAWFKGVKTDEDKAKREASIRASSHILDLITELMDEDDKSLSNAETASKVYDNPNWAYKQADVNGYRRCLKVYKDLLNLDQKETKQ